MTRYETRNRILRPLSTRNSLCDEPGKSRGSCQGPYILRSHLLYIVEDLPSEDGDGIVKVWLVQSTLSSGRHVELVVTQISDLDWGTIGTLEPFQEGNKGLKEVEIHPYYHRVVLYQQHS